MAQSRIDLARECIREFDLASLLSVEARAQIVARYMPNPTDEETGWVIEREDSEPSHPMYFAGKNWSYNNLEAIRFARKGDAETVCRYMFPGQPHRIADHAWVI